MWVDSGQFFFYYRCTPDERDCRGKSEVSESYLAGIQKDRFGGTSLPQSTINGIRSTKRFRRTKKWKKVLRLINVAMSGLPAEIFLAINVVVFVGAG